MMRTTIRTNSRFLTVAGWRKDIFQIEEAMKDRRGSQDFTAAAAELEARMA
jgi:hypothetical protein